MGDDFFLTPMELIFLAVAVLVTVPILFFLRYVLKELRQENKSEKNQPGPN